MATMKQLTGLIQQWIKEPRYLPIVYESFHDAYLEPMRGSLGKTGLSLVFTPSSDVRSFDFTGDATGVYTVKIKSKAGIDTLFKFYLTKAELVRFHKRLNFRLAEFEGASYLA